MKPGVTRFWEFLAGHRTGDLVVRQEILDATGWKDGTLKTYLTKNKLTRFLQAAIERDVFRVLRDGADVLESEVAAALSQVTDTPLQIQVGDQLIGARSRYACRELLGRGAMAQVWRARALGGGDVAVKIFDPQSVLVERTLHDDLARRFRREANNGLILDHPRVIRTIDVGQHEDVPFLVLELAKRSLAARLRAEGAMSVPASLPIVRACSEALLYLHGRGVQHRDVKPDNVLETDRGFVLSDLGIARWSDWNPAFLSAGSMTDDAIRLGTLAYIAPEQQRHPHDVTNASDVYSLGVMWYELLTLRTETQAAFVMGVVPPPSDDEAVNALIRRMTRFDPAERPRLPEIGQFLAGRGVA